MAFLRALANSWARISWALLIGVALGLATARAGRQVQPLLAREDVVTVLFLSGFALAILAASRWNQMVDYWRRLRRTLELPSAELPFSILALISFAAWFAASSASRTDGETLPPDLLAFLLWASATTTLWFVATAIVALRSEQVCARRARPLESRPGRYSDAPITTLEEDALERGYFVKSTYDRLLNRPMNDSFVATLVAPWGSGKTSALNLLLAKADRDPTIVTVRFNPWLYTTDAGIVEGLFREVDLAVARQFLAVSIRPLLRKYAAAVSIGSARYGALLGFLGKETADSLRTRIDDWLVRNCCRLLVVIDDIDRLQPDELLKALKLVRLTLNLRNAVFVLTMDKGAVVASLSAVLEGKEAAEAYLAKIAEDEILLPEADPETLHQFVLYDDPRRGHRSEVSKILDQFLPEGTPARDRFERRIVLIYRGQISNYVRNLRDGKRLLNGFAAAAEALGREVDTTDLMILEALRCFEPNAHHDIWLNRSIYLGTSSLDSTDPMSIMDHVEGDVVKRHVDQLLQDAKDPESLVELLSLLFPPVSTACRPRYQPEGTQRVADPERLRKYFLARVPESDVSDQDVADLLDELESLEPSAADARALEALQSAEENHKLRRLLNALTEQCGPSHAGASRAVARALTALCPKLSEEQLPFSASDRHDAMLAIRSVVAQLGSPQATELLRELTMLDGSLPTMAFVIRPDWLEAQGDRLNPAAALKAFDAQLRAVYIDSGRDLMLDVPPLVGTRLLWEAVERGEMTEHIRAYVRSRLDNREMVVGLLELWGRIGEGDARALGVLCDPAAAMGSFEAARDGLDARQLDLVASFSASLASEEPPDEQP